jgi:hypothetical protein
MSWRHMREWSYSSTILDVRTKYEGLTSRPSRLTPVEVRADLFFRWIVGLVGPLEAVWTVYRREKSCPCPESNPGFPTRHYTDWAIPTLLFALVP